MPFTLSHVFAVVPFKKMTPNHLSVSGLVMGSMAPDFEYFVRVTLYGVWGHTPLGVFLFDLPISIIICLVFHSVVRDPLIYNLPQFFFRRFERFLGLNWASYLLKNKAKVVVSIFIGIFTHFLWDNFTHHPNYVSPFYFDVLLEKVTFLSNEMPVYNVLQLISSIVGMAGFLFVIYSLKPTIKKNSLTSKVQIDFWIRVVAVLILVVGIRYLIGVPTEKPKGQFVVISISAFMISLIINSWFWKMKYNINELQKSDN